MNWDATAVARLSKALMQRYLEMVHDVRTDRRNFSALWNKVMESHGITVVRVTKESGGDSPISILKRMVHLVNYENEKVSDALVVPNPDRESQYLLVPRESASRILVLGMM